MAERPGPRPLPPPPRQSDPDVSQARRDTQQRLRENDEERLRAAAAEQERLRLAAEEEERLRAAEEEIVQARAREEAAEQERLAGEAAYNAGAAAGAPAPVRVPASRFSGIASAFGLRPKSNTGASTPASTPTAPASTPTAAGAPTSTPTAASTPTAPASTPAAAGASVAAIPQQNAKRNVNEPIQVIFKDINGNPITASVKVGEVTLTNNVTSTTQQKPSTFRQLLANAVTRSSLGGKKARRITRKNKKSNKRRYKR